MKYLFIIAALSAGTAQGAEYYRYTPESVEICVGYEQQGTGIGKNSCKTFNSPGPSQSYSITFNDLTSSNTDRLDLDPPTAYEQISAGGDGVIFGPRSANAKLTILYNSAYEVAATANYDQVNGGRTPVTPTERNPFNRYLPGSDEGTWQNVRLTCGIPEYLDSVSSSVTWSWDSLHIENLTKGGGYSYHPIAYGTCRIRYKPVYKLTISILNGTMNIRELAGDKRTYSNTITTVGGGGNVNLRIENPNSNEIAVSFSETDENATTETVVPSMTGVSKNFYVQPKKTNPGEYTYRVNFTAEYE